MEKILISRSQPKILRKIQKKLRRYISEISRFLHVCWRVLQIKSPSYQIFIGAACLHFAIKIKNNDNNLDALHGEIAVEGSPLHVTRLASVLVLLHVLQ